jgi:hypothetical protein
MRISDSFPIFKEFNSKNSVFPDIKQKNQNIIKNQIVYTPTIIHTF